VEQLKQIENTFSLLLHLLQDFALFLEPYASEISSVDIVVDRGSMVALAQQGSSPDATPAATSSSSAASSTESDVAERVAEHDHHEKLPANSTIRSSKIAVVEFINEVSSKLCFIIDFKFNHLALSLV
jgi:hypothetical protein